jgi:hypothetical protein
MAASRAVAALRDAARRLGVKPRTRSIRAAPLKVQMTAENPRPSTDGYAPSRTLSRQTLRELAIQGGGGE